MDLASSCPSSSYTMSKGLTAPHSITTSLAWATAIACLSTLQFGYHLAELNAAEGVLTGLIEKPGPLDSYLDTFWSKWGCHQFIPMSEKGVATITTMLTVGGLISLVIAGSSIISTRYGRKQICMVNLGLYILGSLIMAFSNSIWSFSAGRLINGFAAGSSLVISPILVNELTPINHRGLLGSILQLAVAVGILMAQIAGYFLSNDQQWRQIFVLAALIGVAQFLVLFTTVESPKWIILNKGNVQEAKSILKNLRLDQEALEHEINHWRRLSPVAPSPQVNEMSALLEGSVTDNDTTKSFEPLTQVKSRRGSIDPDHVTFSNFLTHSRYNREKVAVIGLMMAQQLCGINAITFYGVRILAKIVPKGTNVLVITCSISLCNVLFALGASPCVDRLGRKPLLISSALIMGVSAFLIATGFVINSDYLTGGACFGFVLGYSIGLAQIPFLMISEIASHDTLGAAQSMGGAVNWICSISIAFFFPILNDIVGGYIFYGFSVICALFVVFVICFIPETKDHLSPQEVWLSFEEEQYMA